jgi:hypothetical protein
MASESKSHHASASAVNDHLTWLEAVQMVLIVAISGFGVYFVWVT